MSKGIVILLNGVSSAGKTTLAHVLQDKLEQPYYYLAQDLFCQLLSRRHRNQDFWGRTTQSVSALHHTIASFSALGLNVIVDHILLDTPHTRGWLPECVRLLQTHRVFFVQVWCPLEELERREAARGDRRIGQARQQFNQRYDNLPYDLTVDTATNSPEACADEIITALTKPDSCRAFYLLAQALSST
jgi:chloramphenicol 3-O phosphotransferase